MAKIWQVLTENAVSKKQVNFNVVEMSDIDATMAIQEAHYEAGAVMATVHDIAESMLEFGIESDRRDLSPMEYIAEAFDFGGFFRKIFDFLIKMWNTIVNYLRALIGNKFGASGNVVKNLQKIKQNFELLDAKTFDTDAEITIKNYTEMTSAGTFAGVLTSPQLYLETALLDKVESKIWKAKGISTPGSKMDKDDFNIIAITAAAAGIASDVEALQTNRAAGTETDNKGNAVGGGQRNSTGDINATKKDIESAVVDIKAFNSKLSLGEKGAVESFNLLIEAIAKKKEAKGSVIKTVSEKAKIKDAKSLTEMIRSLLSYFFPTDTGTRSIKGDSSIKAQLTAIKGVIGAAVNGNALEAGETLGASNIKFEALVDPIKAGLKVCEDVLAELKRAASIIQGFKKEDLVAIDKKGEVGSQDTSAELAKKMTELGTELMTLESAMQQVITKGMDAGAVLLETITREVLAQTELMLKAPADRVKKASVENVK